MSIEIDLESLRQELIVLLKAYLADKTDVRLRGRMVSLYERVGYGGSSLFDKEINQALGLIEDLGYKVNEITNIPLIKDELIINLISKLEQLKVRKPFQ